MAIREKHPIADLPEFFMGAFTELQERATAAGAKLTAPPFARYFSMPPDDIDVEAVFPVDVPVQAEGRVHPIVLEGGSAVEVLHIGPYDGLGAAYGAIEAWLKAHGVCAGGPPREVYLSGPGVNPAEIRTLVVQPIAEAG